MHVKQSVVTAAPITVVWAALRPFGDIAAVINLAAGYNRASSFLLVRNPLVTECRCLTN